MKDGKGYDPVTGAEVKVPDTAEDVVNSNYMRSAIDAAWKNARCACPARTNRCGSSCNALFKEPDGRACRCRRGPGCETSAAVKAKLKLVQAASLLGSQDKARRLAAVRPGREPGTRTPSCCSTSASRTKPTPRSRPPSRPASPASTARWSGAPPGRHLQRHQPRLGAVAGRAGAGHHLRPDGRHQHGARRADDDRRLRHLRHAGRVPALPAESMFGWAPGGGHPRVLPGIGPGRRRAGARRDRFLYGRPLETLLATWNDLIAWLQLVGRSSVRRTSAWRTRRG